MAPETPSGSESVVAMEPRNTPLPRASNGGCTRPELAARLSLWDELDPLAARELSEHAGVCPACGPSLQLLQQAQAWLERGPAGANAASVCPSAEDLYDFGRGPGARVLSEPERMSLKAHVAGCAECGALVLTLASRPPVPLLGDELPEEPVTVAAGELDRVAPPRSVTPRGWRHLAWIPVAVAAATIAMFVWPSESQSRERSSGSIRFPTQPLLRGAADDALLFPRDRVLRGSNGLFATPVFEIAPRERATSYRVRVFRHDGRAFAEGGEIGSLTGDGATLDASTLREQLVAGHFTWEAWTVVDGLDLPLGRRDFEVIEDDALIEAIDARREAPEPARSEAILHLLHDSGFAGDARAFARSLPPSPERDAYLARLPGR